MDAEERPRPPGLGRVGAGVFGVEMDDGGKNSHCPWKNCHKNVLRGEKIVLRWEIKSPSQREFKMSFSEGKIIPKNPFEREKARGLGPTGGPTPCGGARPRVSCRWRAAAGRPLVSRRPPGRPRLRSSTMYTGAPRPPRASAGG